MDKSYAQSLDTALAQLEERQGRGLDMFIAIDGFVDEIIHVVRQRHDANHYDRIETIAEYADRIARAAGLSTNIEYVPINVKLGGNGPILANALLEYGIGVTYAGAIGKPDIHPVFKPMAERCKAVYSICEPGHTDAVEFFDGKLIIGKHDAFRQQITWENFKSTLGGVERIAEIISGCDLLGMENWVMVSYMSQIWDGMLEEVFPLLPDKTSRPLAFFDLCDPEKRSREDFRYALEQIGKFEAKFTTMLGLNEKEAYETAELFGISVDESLPEDDKLRTLVEAIYDRLDISALVVHPTRCAAVRTREGYFSVAGPYCEKPVLTTGAGDNFNAGFCYAMALGLDPRSALVTGVSTSGFYVRNGKSPTAGDLNAFIRQWREGTLA